ncbi:MAG: hypothetical protein J7623_13710 [Chitinophaga sp.]|uniref:hypothetical protein n=1 Tax=Chitinophaga sp. TaxID=1869181 RepID=UPI001B0D1499|nr:hypothetical protein [Chitinophaga sp.]MBO9729688.1 hypothetical protein [Chitinophaga sp.]
MKMIWKFANGILIVGALLWIGALVVYVFTTDDLLFFQQWEDRKLVGHSRKVMVPGIEPLLTAAYKKNEEADTARYNAIQLHLVHNKPSRDWPVKTGYPLPGALLPYNRIVAFYGNLYSDRMGILGQLPGDDMIKQLATEADKWRKADTCIPVVPALHYIAVTAQRNPGKDRKYRLRMPDSEITKVFTLAQKGHAIVFLDIQVGLSTLQEELPLLEKYLVRPDVHLGIDPEYSMKYGQVPCTAIGTFDAIDINEAISWLADLVRKYHLPPKILIIHRFTQGMVTNYKQIRLQPEVQVVMNMDGFGGVAKKTDTYKSWISGQPVQFTGFKLFYENDVVTGGHLMEPAEVLALYPQPIYIQYQ